MNSSLRFLSLLPFAKGLYLFPEYPLPVLQLLAKLLKSKNPDDLQEANKLIKSMVKEVRNSCGFGPSQQSAFKFLSNLTSKWWRALGSGQWQNLGFSGSGSIVLVHSLVKLWGLNETDHQRHTAFYYFFKTANAANLHLVPVVAAIKGMPSDDLVGLCVIWTWRNFDSSLQLGDVCITKMSTAGVSGGGQGTKG